MPGAIARVTGFAMADLRAVVTDVTVAEVKAEAAVAAEVAALNAVSAAPEQIALCRISNGIVLMPTASLCQTVATRHPI